ncbi:unnamed protein product [Orchesella dallaii]|uniref:Uncharacterized protein n=1 Tax=Orchesella dallaii TaxID=48710 RepID=A0ABP1Q8J4_9HEXA
MFQSSNSASRLFLLSFASLLLISQTLADHNDHEKHCQSDTDCGFGATCNRGICGCTNKEQVFVPEADSHCHPLGTIGGVCKYDLQCTKRDVLSRCHNSKCECYDTRNNGIDVIKEYKGTCYDGTAIDEECRDNNQCKAFIFPEEHVSCKHSSNENKFLCRCDEGIKCEHKSGNSAQSVQVGYLTIISIFGFMALVKTMF